MEHCGGSAKVKDESRRGNQTTRWGVRRARGKELVKWTIQVLLTCMYLTHWQQWRKNMPSDLSESCVFIPGQGPCWSLWPYHTDPLPTMARPRQAWWCPVWLSQACWANCDVTNMCAAATAASLTRWRTDQSEPSGTRSPRPDWGRGGWGGWHRCAECLRCQPCAF